MEHENALDSRVRWNDDQADLRSNVSVEAFLSQIAPVPGGTMKLSHRRDNRRKTMPSTSRKQQALMCIALSIKQGKARNSYSREAARISRQMSEEQLKEFCKSPIEA